MANFQCPLCKQEVTQSIYERITGIWQEKEKQMASLKEKEKQLKEKERNLQERFLREKKQLLEQERSKFQKQLSIQQQQSQEALKKEHAELERQRSKINADYNKKLSTEISKIHKHENIKLKQREIELKKQFSEHARVTIMKENEKLQHEKHLQKNRYDQLNRQYNSLHSKSIKDLEKSNLKIKSLEEQVEKNQTPQVLGLLEEDVFLSKLREMFPSDKFDHTGKGGDIIQYVLVNKAEIGKIVFELKKVGTFSPAHIVQAYEAKQKRNADYAILVTNAKRKKDDFGFFVQKGVIIIHPAGAPVLVSIIRDHIIAISKMKLTGEKRSQAIAAVLDYIQGPSFKNGIESIIIDTIDLHNKLKKEIKDHISSWESRLEKYRNINTNANTIGNKVVNIFLPVSEQKRISGEEISNIQLPVVIK